MLFNRTKFDQSTKTEKLLRSFSCSNLLFFSSLQTTSPSPNACGDFTYTPEQRPLGFGFSIVVSSAHYHPPASKWGRQPWLQVLDMDSKILQKPLDVKTSIFSNMVPRGKTAPVLLSVFMGCGCCHQEVPGFHERVELFPISFPLVQMALLLTS